MWVCIYTYWIEECENVCSFGLRQRTLAFVWAVALADGRVVCGGGVYLLRGRSIDFWGR